MRTITLEEHYATSAFIKGPGRHLENQLAEQLCDLGDRRIAAMDAGDRRASALAEFPRRGAARGDRGSDPCVRNRMTPLPMRCDVIQPASPASPRLPTAAPDLAAEELERTVRKLGFPGAP